MIDTEGHYGLLQKQEQPRVACDFVIQVVTSHDHGVYPERWPRRQ